MSDWDPASYAAFGDFRLRPALDLMAGVGTVPTGPIVDLGCGAGAVAAALKARFDRDLVGVEVSPAMAAKAREPGAYSQVIEADLAHHVFETPPALIFSNAALNWVPDHEALVSRLVRALAPEGWLAFQVPFQHDAPSHALARAVAHDLDPITFPETSAQAYVLAPEAYDTLLAPHGEARVWVTDYGQRLAPVAAGHPVRAFTQSTYLRPYLDHFAARGRAETYLDAYDAALAEAYPADARGGVWFPFKRLFATLQLSPR